MPHRTEPINLSLPCGLKQKAATLGVNCSYEAAKAIAREVKERELMNNAEGTA